MDPRTQKIATGSAFIALAVSAGYFLAQFPNLELVTAIIFMGGYKLGWRQGAMIGMLAEAIYSGFNPYGIPPLPVLGAQILGMMLAGVTGGLLSQKLPGETSRKKLVAVLALSGFAITLIFDLGTTVATALMVGFSWASFIGLVAFGSVFYLLHMVSNTLIFALLLPLVLRGPRFFSHRRVLPKVMESTAPCE